MDGGVFALSDDGFAVDWEAFLYNSFSDYQDVKALRYGDLKVL